MGCHGSQGQKVGGDFSVLLANGRTGTRIPEIIQEDEEQGEIMQRNTEKYLNPSGQ